MLLLFLGEVIKHFICSVCAGVGAGARFGFLFFKMLFDNPWILLFVSLFRGAEQGRGAVDIFRS